MHEDWTINGKEFRVVIEPLSIASPEGPSMALFERRDGKLVRIYKKPASLKTEAELLELSRSVAEDQASSSLISHT